MAELFLSMNIEIKRFYFIKDGYFAFASDSFLMKNKEEGKSGPCFLAVRKESGII